MFLLGVFPEVPIYVFLLGVFQEGPMIHSVYFYVYMYFSWCISGRSHDSLRVYSSSWNLPGEVQGMQ